MWVTVKSLGIKIPAKIFFALGFENREMQIAFIRDDERLIIGNKLGKQRKNKEDKEYPETPPAAAVGNE